MKVILCIALCLLFVSHTTRANEPDACIGFGLAYGTGAEELGVHAQGKVALSETLHVAADVRAFLMSELASYWTINANVHYVVFVHRSLEFFALSGVNYATVGIGLNSGGLGGGGLNMTSRAVGLNIGGGFNLNVERIILCPELKVVVGEFDQFVASATVLFRL